MWHRFSTGDRLGIILPACVRDLISNIPGLGFGACAQQDLTSPTTDDTDAVPSGDAYFYLVTAENRLAENGTKGFQSDTTEREGTLCPSEGKK